MSSGLDSVLDKVKEMLGLGSEGTATTTTSGVVTPSSNNDVAGSSTVSSSASTSGDQKDREFARTTSEAKKDARGPNEQTGQVGDNTPSQPSQSSATSTSGPAFDPAKVTVIYVLGGPGAGKGTQCAKLVAQKDFAHISAGDLLRAEQNREGSETGAMIRHHIKEGIIVPSEVTIGLLREAMQKIIEQEGKHKFLIDGFPRKLDQAQGFDETVVPGSAVLFLMCPEETLLQRLLERSKTSGREDDNIESIRKRFRIFIDTSMPVVDYYRTKGKVINIDSSKPVDAVYADILAAIDNL